MNIFNILSAVKEINDKLIIINIENTHLKEKIYEFDRVFRETVDKLIEKRNESEKNHIKEIAALRSEIETLKSRFDIVTEKAIMQKINAIDLSQVNIPLSSDFGKNDSPKAIK